MGRTLDGMVIIITGASAGIGRALAIELSRSGARLALAARRIDKLESLNRELGGGHLCVAADVSRREDCEALIAQTINRFGKIDTLVCNAGYGFLAPVAETSPERMQAIFQTNVFGTLNCVRAAVPQMLKQDVQSGWRGQVMMVSSVVARRAIPFFGAYSATKAAQLSLAESMRIELARYKIAVTSVHPGGTETDFGEVSASMSGGAIRSPRPEVWPMSIYRWFIGIGTLVPSLIDRVLLGRADQIGGT
jgi:NAD(P)-dependent dehydrogenase (short-subunit alcohol dehydrogenase family)